jgi:hypothetical protein
MKITRRQLRQIINEEMSRSLNEANEEALPAGGPAVPDGRDWLITGPAVPWKAAGKSGCVSLVGGDDADNVHLFLYVSREGGATSCENMKGTDHQVGKYKKNHKYIQALTKNPQKAFDDKNFLSWINHQSGHKLFPHGPIPKKDDTGNGSGNAGDNKSSGGDSQDSGLPDKTVRYDRGKNVRDEVKQIQTALKKLDAWDKGPTGKFDKEFRSALRKWQGKVGLSADGVYGTNTKKKLEKELSALNESWLRMAGITG